MGTFVAHYQDDHDSYDNINLKQDKPGWKKAEPIERVYIKYDPKKNLPTHGAILPNQRYNKVKKFPSAVYITNQENQNLTTSQKELL